MTKLQNKVLASQRVSGPGGVNNADNLPRFTGPNATETNGGIGPQENRANMNALKDSTPSRRRDANVDTN
jgi:hypothetical protein